MIGACGISAFPMSARVIHQMGQKKILQFPADAGSERKRWRTDRLCDRRRIDSGTTRIKRNYDQRTQRIAFTGA
jgi:hypothetical protein